MSFDSQQRKELNKAIADYLDQNGFKTTSSVFRHEAVLPQILKRRYRGMLERQWILYNRLQREASELEIKLHVITKRLSQGINEKLVPAEWIPRTPERFSIAGHGAAVNKIIFHPNLAIMVTASDDTSIRCWNITTGNYVGQMEEHEEAVQDICFNPDPNFLASGSSDFTIKIWNFDNKKCIQTLLGHEGEVTSVHYLPGGDRLVSSSRDNTLKLWYTITGHCIKTFIGHTDWVRMVKPSLTGKLLASCSNDEIIRIWDTNHRNKHGKLKHQFTTHDDVVECLAWAPKSCYRVLLTAEEWDTPPEPEEDIHSDQEENTEGAAAPIKRKPVETRAVLASGSRDKTIRIWHVGKLECLFIMYGHENWVRDLAFSPFGNFLVSVGDDKTLRAWDLRTGQCTRVIEAHDQFCLCVAFHKRSPLVATGSGDHTVKLWSCR